MSVSLDHQGVDLLINSSSCIRNTCHRHPRKTLRPVVIRIVFSFMWSTLPTWSLMLIWWTGPSLEGWSLRFWVPASRICKKVKQQENILHGHHVIAHLVLLVLMHDAVSSDCSPCYSSHGFDSVSRLQSTLWHFQGARNPST